MNQDQGWTINILDEDENYILSDLFATNIAIEYENDYIFETENRMNHYRRGTLHCIARSNSAQINL